MNSLESYKDQVYNIGSPSPGPKKSPFKGHPRDFESEFQFSDSPCHKSKPKRSATKSKIPKVPSATKKPTKRKLVETKDISESPLKKLKMISEDQFNQYIKNADEKAEATKKDTADQLAGILAKFEARMDNLAKDTDDTIAKGLSKFDSRLDGLANKLDKVIKDNIEANDEVKSELVNMKEQVSGLQNSLDDQRIKFENKLVQLEENFSLLSESVMSASTKNIEEIKEALVPIVKEEVIESVKKDLKKEIIPPVKATWNAIQAQKVWEHEHSLLAFGLDSQKNPMEVAEELLKNELDINNENMLKISVKKAVRLGKLEGNKVPPLLVTFGHPSERNLALSHSKNLKNKKISLKKSVPKNYKDEYKKFEDEAFKLRNMPGLEYQTQIIFDSHMMLLRVKLKDTNDNKYHFTTHSSYEPEMESETEAQKSNIKIPKGTKASPIPGMDVMTKANNSVFMTVKGMTEEITEDSFKRELLSYLNAEHRSSVLDFKLKKKGLAIIFCDSWSSASLIATSYKETFMGHPVNFSLFCTKDPEMRQ